MENNKVKVLTTFVESGMGHIVSAQAIVDSLKERDCGNMIIDESYILRESRNTEKFERYITKNVQRTNSIRGFGNFIFKFLEIMGGQRLLRLTAKTLFAKARKDTLYQMRMHSPDIVVSTHYWMTYCAIEYKKLYNHKLSIITYNPDNNTHVWWDSRDGLFLVNSEEAAEEAVNRRGFDEKNIIPVNYTIRKSLENCKISKEEARAKYNLPQDQFTVVVADGAYALGKSIKFTKKIAKTDKDITILFIAGKNARAYEYMTQFKKRLILQGKTNVDLRVFRFTHDIHELYKAADIFITKAGPNAILDSVYMGTPVIVNFCPQPMEQAAYRHYIKHQNCGLGVFRASKIRDVIENFIDNPYMLEQYKRNTVKFAKMENGANQVASIVIEQANQILNNTEKVTSKSAAQLDANATAARSINEFKPYRL